MARKKVDPVNEVVETVEAVEPVETVEEVAPVEVVDDGCYPAYLGDSNQLTEGLRALSIPADYLSRKEIAKANGIDNYLGLGRQNLDLLLLLKAGKLKKN